MVNYKQSIKKIVSETMDMSLTKNGTDIINKLIDSLNLKLVNFCLELDRTKDEMNVVKVRNVVNELYPGNLKGLALAEGNRILTLYNNGLIAYKPDYPDLAKRKKKTKKAIAVEALEFTGGISVLTSMIFPEVSLQDQANGILCDLLEEIAMKISDLAQEKKNDNITLEDVRDALGHLFPPEILKHALAEGARTTMLYETGMLREMDRKVKEDGRKPARKMQRSPSIKTPPIPRKRRKPSARKISKKKTIRETSHKRVKPKVSRKKSVPRKFSRKMKEDGRKPARKKQRSPSVKTPPIPRKRRKPSARKFSKKKTIRKTSHKRAKPKVSRKKHVPRKFPRKISKKRVTKRAPSRKRRAPSKKRTAVQKAPKRVSPKTVRRISKKPTKKKLVSEKVTPQRITTTTTKEINRGIRKLNESYRQTLQTESLKLTTEFISNLLDRLIEEMAKLKSSVIGPQEVRRSVMKVFPPNLADLAVAHLSRVLMH